VARRAPLAAHTCGRTKRSSTSSATITLRARRPPRLATRWANAATGMARKRHAVLPLRVGSVGVRDANPTWHLPPFPLHTLTLLYPSGASCGTSPWLLSSVGIMRARRQGRLLISNSAASATTDDFTYHAHFSQPRAFSDLSPIDTPLQTKQTLTAAYYCWLIVPYAAAPFAPPYDRV